MSAPTPVGLGTLIQQDHTELLQEATDSTGTKPANPSLFPNQEYSPSSKMKEENRQSQVDRLI